MNYKIWIAAAATFVLTACGGEKSQEMTLREGKGGIWLGGTFRYNEEEFLKTLSPVNITEVTGSRVIDQIYEGLVMLDQADLTIKPQLAKSWDVNPEGTVYTFHLRTGIRFQDDPSFPDGKGREITAKDFKYCLDRLCYYNPAENQGFWIFRDLVKGANDYQELTKNKQDDPNGVSGVTVINDSTLQIELVRPFSVFLDRMALPFARVYPKEAVEEYGTDMRIKAVGTGPFQVKLIKENEVVFLTRNPNYWGYDEHGNQLPYLDNIKISFIKEKKTELLAFQKGDLDMVYRLPFDMKEDVVDADDNLKEPYTFAQVQATNSMTIQYYGFLHANPVFGDKRVRQAFCYAIDRDKICRFTIKASGAPAIYGYVPPKTGSYDVTNVKGYSYDPERARNLLEEAGYPKGKGFPKVTLQLNSGGGRNEQVAQAIQKMLTETLNIQVELLQVPWAQHTESIESAKVQFWRLGWVADYPDPENFLNLFYGKWVPDDINVKTYLNSFRYKSAKFDEVYERALSTVDETARNALYNQADQIAIDDAVALPIYYDRDHRLLQPNVRNFPQNGMEYRNFTMVSFVPKEK